MTASTCWMRIVGLLYVVDAIMMAFVHAPIKAVGPERTLSRASAGDPTGRFLVDTWAGFGSEVAAIGVGLLAFSAKPAAAQGLAWTVLAVEVLRGIAYDLYMLWRGYDAMTFGVWIVIHGAVIVSGLVVLRRVQPTPVYAS